MLKTLGEEFWRKRVGAFEPWIGQEVIVHLDFGLVKASMRGSLLQDLEETLVMRPVAGPQLELAKTKVLAIEEVEHQAARHRRYLAYEISPRTTSRQSFTLYPKA